MKPLPLVLTFFLLISSTPAFAAFFEIDFPELVIPESMRVEIVSDHMKINGVDSRVLAFYSEESNQALDAFYEAEWKGDIARGEFGGWRVLSRREGDYFITVQMKVSDLNSSQGFISIANVFKALGRAKRRSISKGLPLLPDTEIVQDIQSEDLGKKSRTYILSSEQSVNQNLEFYKSYFSQMGYEPISYGALMKGSTSGAMLLNRGNARVDIAVVESRGKTIITIVQVKM